MKTNSRKEQEKMAVLLEISDTPKKNSDIIKGAESRLIMDEAYGYEVAPLCRLCSAVCYGVNVCRCMDG